MLSKNMYSDRFLVFPSTYLIMYLNEISSISELSLTRFPNNVIKPNPNRAIYKIDMISYWEKSDGLTIISHKKRQVVMLTEPSSIPHNNSTLMTILPK